MAESLSDSEELALVGLLRTLVRLDGRGSIEERDAYRVALETCLAPRETTTETPYRVAPATQGFDEHLAALEARADRELQDDKAVRNAALAVKRQDARETIFAALADVAAADAIAQAEGALLDWLALEWKIEIADQGDGEGHER
jgi:hypothetical protein